VQRHRSHDDPSPAAARDRWPRGRAIVLVGLMGAGKSSVGRRLAQRLAVAFADADTEIERAAGMSVADIFEGYGEAAFRETEARVIARLLDGGSKVLATGGGAFLNEATRASIRARAVSVWLKADLEVLVARTRGRGGRPLLAGTDPREKLAQLMAARYPVYAEADVIVTTAHEPVDATVSQVYEAVCRHCGRMGPDAAEVSG
jgi:shikimate kinase